MIYNQTIGTRLLYNRIRTTSGTRRRFSRRNLPGRSRSSSSRSGTGRRRRRRPHGGHCRSGRSPRDRGRFDFADLLDGRGSCVTRSSCCRRRLLDDRCRRCSLDRGNSRSRRLHRGRRGGSGFPQRRQFGWSSWFRLSRLGVRLGFNQGPPSRTIFKSTILATSQTREREKNHLPCRSSRFQRRRNFLGRRSSGLLANCLGSSGSSSSGSSSSS